MRSSEQAEYTPDEIPGEAVSSDPPDQSHVANGKFAYLRGNGTVIREEGPRDEESPVSFQAILSEIYAPKTHRFPEADPTQQALGDVVKKAFHP